jgi:hypothetical protein
MVLNAGSCGGSMKEVKLDACERLVGVKSKLYKNSPDHNTYHCNLVLVIGKLE